MKRILMTVGLTLLSHILVGSTYSQSWKNIVPLKSTCEDIKKEWGVEECEYPLTRIKTDSHWITIKLTTEKCDCVSKNSFNEWLVAKGTVEWVSITLIDQIDLRQYKSKSTFTSFKKTPVADLPGNYLYVDTKNGERLEVTSSNAIATIYLFPNAESASSLRCKFAPPFSLE